MMCRRLGVIVLLACAGLARAASAQTPPPNPAQPSPFKGAFAASLNLLAMEHTTRILFQPKTRRELGGPFFADYIHSIRMPKTWDDGDAWYVNYVGHPLHGAAAGRAWLVHHPNQLLDI